MASLESREMLISNGKLNFRMNNRMYISVFLCSLLMMITGNIGAWTSPMLKKLNGTEDNPLGRVLTVNEISWLASIPILGSIFGSFLYGTLAQGIGRKPLLTSMGVPCLMFFVILSLSKVYWLYLFAKILGGVSAGGIMVILPLYICEVAIPEVRGRLMALMFAAVNIGILTAYCVAPYISFYHYHICLSIVPLCFLIFFHAFSIESPYYVLQKDPAKVEQVLRKLRGKNNVTQELNKMRAGSIKSLEGGLVDLFLMKATRRALIIALGLRSFSLFSGSVVILTYIQFVFDAAGGVLPGEVDAIIIGIVQLITAFISSVVADKVGRKPLLILTYSCIALSQGVLGGYFTMKNNGIDTTGLFSYIPIFTIMLHVTAFSFELTLSGLIVGEIFPCRVKNIANAVCTVYACLTGFLMILLFLRIQNAIGLGDCCWVFAGFATCASIFVMTVLVETKGKTLEQIQDELNGVQGNSYTKLREVDGYGAVDHVN